MAPPKSRAPPQAPPTFTATPESLVADAKTLCEESKKVLDDVVATVKIGDARFENTVLPMARNSDEDSLKSRIIAFYQSMSTEKALRDASTEADKIMTEAAIEMSMRDDVFAVVDAAFKAKGQELDPESQRLLEKTRKSYIRNGLGLEKGPKRDRFKEVSKRISEVEIQFSKNLNEEDGGLWLTTEELDGLPQDVLDGLAKGEGENEGKLKLSFKYPDIIPAMKYVLDSDVRKRIMIADENKNADNIPLFKEAIVLRDEMARLLGYADYAAFTIEERMAKTPQTVLDFLDDIKTKLAPAGVKEMAHLQEIKNKDMDSRGLSKSNDGQYYLWDHRFYGRIQVETEYSVDEKKISEYFPLQKTVEGMLKIFEELFGLEFVQIEGTERDKISPTGKGNDIVWHEDVKLFSVWDDEGEGSGFVGYLYLDLHPRPGKYTHAANFNLQPGFLYPNGTRRYPATSLICNFSKPTATKPSLLKHNEVVTLFHELGHGIHDLVSRTTYTRFHGTSVVRDFVEAPSQMLEHWCWTPSQLKSISSHYESAAPIPDELVTSIVKSRYVNSALFNLRQLHFGYFDLAVHMPATHAAAEALKCSEMYNNMRASISGMKGPEAIGLPADWGHGQTTFGHLMGGYGAGYYSYLWSQVFSADMFVSVFEKDPMDGVQGRRYRHAVLEMGGKQDEMVTLVGFLGRRPDGRAFYGNLGIGS